MEKTWHELQLRIPAAGVDLASYLLTEIGCQGVVTSVRKLDTFIPPDPNEADQGEQLLQAYFPPEIPPAQLLSDWHRQQSQLAALLPDWQTTEPELRPVRQEDWSEGWKQHFTGFKVGRLLIKPSWEESPAETAELVMEIDPGMAFGTGTHATTRLCLEALARELEQHPAARVLDVGTGSGILAIAAAKLGAELVVGTDIDADACRIARENAELNAVDRQLNITNEPLEALVEAYDIVLANILAEENIRLAQELVGHLAPGGMLILSGILAEKQTLVCDAFAGFGLSPPEVRQFEEWVAICYQKPMA